MKSAHVLVLKPRNHLKRKILLKPLSNLPEARTQRIKIQFQPEGVWEVCPIDVRPVLCTLLATYGGG